MRFWGIRCDNDQGVDTGRDGNGSGNEASFAQILKEERPIGSDQDVVDASVSALTAHHLLLQRQAPIYAHGGFNSRSSHRKTVQIKMRSAIWMKCHPHLQHDFTLLIHQTCCQPRRVCMGLEGRLKKKKGFWNKSASTAPTCKSGLVLQTEVVFYSIIY